MDVGEARRGVHVERADAQPRRGRPTVDTEGAARSLRAVDRNDHVLAGDVDADVDVYPSGPRRRGLVPTESFDPSTVGEIGECLKAHECRTAQDLRLKIPVWPLPRLRLMTTAEPPRTWTSKAAWSFRSATGGDTTPARPCSPDASARIGAASAFGCRGRGGHREREGRAVRDLDCSRRHRSDRSPRRRARQDDRRRSAPTGPCPAPRRLPRAGPRRSPCRWRYRVGECGPSPTRPAVSTRREQAVK